MASRFNKHGPTQAEQAASIGFFSFNSSVEASNIDAKARVEGYLTYATRSILPQKGPSIAELAVQSATGMNPVTGQATQVRAVPVVNNVINFSAFRAQQALRNDPDAADLGIGTKAKLIDLATKKVDSKHGVMDSGPKGYEPAPQPPFNPVPTI